MAVSVEEKGQELLFGEPQQLFQDPMLISGPRRPGYAVTPDGGEHLAFRARGPAFAPDDPRRD